MVRSPKSRGKGNRQRPWRDGGAKRKKPGLPKTRLTSRPPVAHSMWREVEPLPLSNAYRDHPWLFAVYDEYNRPDGLRYQAFLFRNQDRTIFGMKEWLHQRADWPHADLRMLAHRVVCDREFRAELVSDDPDLPALWRRH
jgi:hypothetical protein